MVLFGSLSSVNYVFITMISPFQAIKVVGVALTLFAPASSTHTSAPLVLSSDNLFNLNLKL